MDTDQVVYPIHGIDELISPDEIISYQRMIPRGLKCRFSSQRYYPSTKERPNAFTQLYHIRDYTLVNSTSKPAMYYNNCSKDEENIKYDCPVCGQKLSYEEIHQEKFEEQIRDGFNPNSHVKGGYYSILYFPEDKFSACHSKNQKKTCFIQSQLLYVYDHEKNQFSATIDLRYGTIPAEKIRVCLSFEEKHVLITRFDLKAITVYEFPGLRRLMEVKLNFNEGFYEIMDFRFLDSETIVILVRTEDTYKEKYYHYFIEKKIKLQ